MYILDGYIQEKLFSSRKSTQTLTGYTMKKLILTNINASEYKLTDLNKSSFNCELF